MSVKSIISTHPQYEAVVKTVRSFLANPTFTQDVLMGHGGPMETHLVTEVLHLIDISVPGAAATNIHNYLKGNIDYTGRIVERTTTGLLRHIRALAGMDVEKLPKPSINLGPLSQLFANWPPRTTVDIDTVTNRFIEVTGKTGVILSNEDVKKYAKEAIDHGVTTVDDATNYLNYVLGALNPSGYQVSIDDSIGHQRVLREVTRHIEEGGLVRMEWQCRNYADAIFSNTPRGHSLSEHDIYNALVGIIQRESETARGVFAIGDKPDPFADLNQGQRFTAEEVRRLLAMQGESWTMGKIAEFAIKLWDVNEKNGGPSGKYIAEQVLVALEMGDAKQKPIRNIGDAEVVLRTAVLIDDKDLNQLTAKQEPVRAFEVDDHYRYTRNDVQFVIAREYGQSPEGNPLMGAWVIRNYFTGDYIDHDRHRTDLAERHAIKLE